MGLISKLFTITCAGAGLASASQLPEFAQQYRQQLTGAVEELRIVVTDFDRDAQTSGVSRQEALSSLLGSNETFPKERGASMTKTIARFEVLDQQKSDLEAAEPASRPLFVFAKPDEKLLKGTWEIFEPAVPLNAPGALWGGFGALLLGLLARLPIGLTRSVMARRKRIRVEPQIDQNSTLGAIEIANSSDNADDHNQSFIAHSSNPHGQRSLLDDVVLDQKVIGEVSPEGRIVKGNK
ncbi:MAG: DUF2937 family protein [Salaquimonas sp.]